MFDLTLRYDYQSDVWIASCEDFTASAKKLVDLDKKIAKELRKLGYRGKVKLYMRFDYSTIPEWMRQFHPHYFDRIVEIEI